jgi:hypothetical protein
MQNLKPTAEITESTDNTQKIISQTRRKFYFFIQQKKTTFESESTKKLISRESQRVFMSEKSSMALFELLNRSLDYLITWIANLIAHLIIFIFCAIFFI